MIKKHELTHAIRNQKNPQKTFRPKTLKDKFTRGKRDAIEEFAAQNRMMKGYDIPISRKVREFLYPIESGVGAFRHKATRFDALRNLIKIYL